MRNRFTLNESEKNRIRGLHYDEYESRKMGMWEQDEVVEKHHGKHHEDIDVIPGEEVDDVNSDETTTSLEPTYQGDFGGAGVQDESINEQEESEEEIVYLERTEFNRKIAELEERLTQLEDDYMRKIGFGDHHKAPPPL